MIDLHTSLKIHDFAFKGHISPIFPNYPPSLQLWFSKLFMPFGIQISINSETRQVCMYVLKNNCCILGMVKIIIRYNFALSLYYIDEESCSNLPSKPISTWGTSIPNIFFQGIICVCKYNGKSVLEKKVQLHFYGKSG